MFHTLVKGKLYVIATPIGNLDDISIRAKIILQKISWIACEDTRHSAYLLNHLTIQKKLYSLHEFNEKNQADKLIEKLHQGESGALISDAGTPLISDPGFELIKLAHENKIQVVPIPGPCAVTTALCGLGIGGSGFYFEGFLPAKEQARLKRLTELKTLSQVLIFFEAPHRIKASLKTIEEVFGTNHLVGIARELTKKFESLYRDTIGQLLEQDIPEKGEFVIVVAAESPKNLSNPQTTQEAIPIQNTLKILMTELPLKQAVRLTCQITGIKKNVVYDLALQLMNQASQ